MAEHDFEPMVVLTSAQRSTIELLARLYRGDGHAPVFCVCNLRSEIAQHGTVAPESVPADAVVVYRDWTDDAFCGEHLVPDEGLALDAAGEPVAGVEPC